MPFMLVQMAEFPFLLALPLNLQGQWLWFRLCKIYFTDIPLHSHSSCLTHPILHYCPGDQILVKCIYLSAPQLFTKDRNLNSGVWHIKPNMISYFIASIITTSSRHIHIELLSFSWKRSAFLLFHYMYAWYSPRFGWSVYSHPSLLWPSKLLLILYNLVSKFFPVSSV